jgi:hypothetical protein
MTPAGGLWITGALLLIPAALALVLGLIFHLDMDPVPKSARLCYTLAVLLLLVIVGMWIRAVWLSVA